jgi:hypothetical protein
MTPPECACHAQLQRPFRYVEDALVGVQADAITAGCELVARERGKWMAIYRCRTCGTYWVEACASSGMMDIVHLYPLPEGIQDPAEWLRERGEPLPFRRWEK